MENVAWFSFVNFGGKGLIFLKNQRVLEKKNGTKDDSSMVNGEQNLEETTSLFILLNAVLSL